MAKLRVFVSSTCYDLGVIRSELRPFIVSLGYEPVMSDFSDVLYDPRVHTHESCIKEVIGCDMVLLIIGSRFGGSGIPSVQTSLDFSKLQKLSTKHDLLDNANTLSITQLEVLNAIDQSVPIYTFVDENVLHDHNVYEKNKDKPAVMEELEFPSIQKNETAKYIFEFINFLSHRVKNNSLTSFSHLEHIKGHLLNQWSQLFQRMLSEDRKRGFDTRRYRDFSERIDDLKAVILASIATPNLRDTARGAVKYRHLIGFVSSLPTINVTETLASDLTWEELLMSAQIVGVSVIANEPRIGSTVSLICEDGTFYRFRGPKRMYDQMPIEWSTFVKLDRDNRLAITEALLEDHDGIRFTRLKHVDQQYDEFAKEIEERRSIRELEIDVDLD